MEAERTCFHCKKRIGEDDVRLRQNPIAWEVWDEDVREPMCDAYERDLHDAV